MFIGFVISRKSFDCYRSYKINENLNNLQDGDKKVQGFIFIKFLKNNLTSKMENLPRISKFKPFKQKFENFKSSSKI